MPRWLAITRKRGTAPIMAAGPSSLVGRGKGDEALAGLAAARRDGLAHRGQELARTSL